LLHSELGGAVEIFGKDEAVQLADAWMTITCGRLFLLFVFNLQDAFGIIIEVIIK
jgi:hypothetical protein